MLDRIDKAQTALDRIIKAGNYDGRYLIKKASNELTLLRNDLQRLAQKLELREANAAREEAAAMDLGSPIDSHIQQGVRLGVHYALRLLREGTK